LTLCIQGRVASGIGRGGYFVEKYSGLFEGLLDGKPYPGTLNIVLDNCYNEVLKGVEPVIINPPEPGLCSAVAYKGWIRGVRVVVLRPLASRHDCRVVEVVASVKLRDFLGVRDGDLIEICIE